MVSRRQAAEQSWSLMQQFVDTHSRHGELAAALGFRLGAGRGRVLFQLRDGPLTLTEIAAANGFDAPYTTLVVDKLETHGLVRRTPHPDDRRRKLVALTDEGLAALVTADAIRREPPAAVAALTPRELTDLTALLRRLVDADAAAGKPVSP